MQSGFFVIGLGLISVAAGVSAEQSVTHEAHVHGLAKLTLVAEADVINMQLESPAMNVVGFEHEPKTKEQQKTLEQALKKLNKPDALIAFNGGQCSFAGVDVDNPFKIDAQPDKHEHDEHKHDHDEHDEHEGSEHREFVVEYQAQCKKINELKSINFTLLNEFKAIETLEVQYILSGKQGAVTLNSSASRLSINE